MFRKIIPVVVVIGLFSARAFATCPNQITSIPVQAGGVAYHVVVDDQNCNPIAPANLTFALNTGLNGIVTITPDSTGFSFSVSNINQPAASGTVTFTNTVNGVRIVLSINISPGGVTSLVPVNQ